MQTLNRRLRQNPGIALILAILLVAAFFLTFFHIHEDGSESGCAVCRFVSAISGLIFCAVAAILLAPRQNPVLSFADRSFKFSSRLYASDLSGRAPPVLF